MIFKGQQLDTRISLVIVVFAFLWTALLVRSAYLQWLPNERFSGLQNKLFERTITLKPRRGVIYDRHNREMAISIPSQSLFADPQRMKEPYYAAKKLSELLGIPKKTLLKKLLNKQKRFVWLKRHLEDKEISVIRSWKMKGLHFLKESKRFYTNKESLSQVLGFTGVEGEGLEGIEKQYEEVLRGEPQKVLIKRDARGRPLFMDYSPFISKVSGFDVHLTIDSDLQFYLEKSLKQAIRNSKASSAMGIILSVESSEVLAMANVPGYNPNQPRKTPASYRRNRSVTDMFEPGSTLKVFTIASALLKGFPLSKEYSSHGGELKIGKNTIKEADTKKKFKPFLNMSEILSLSSNVGAASMALDVGAKDLRKLFWKFGFGQKTGIDFPGESSGQLRPLPWRPVEIATVSFGHGIASTALQVVNAYAAIANGGFLKKPLLVKRIKNPYTGEEKPFQSQVVRRVLKEEEARALSLMLISVTEGQGTGVQASVPGYFVAGKTGTAQKVDFKNKGYKEGEYISSFAGFIPAHDPQFVIYLVVDGAKDNFYASSLVAPLFSQVASYSVRTAGISPTLLKEDNIMLASELAEKSQTENPRRPASSNRLLASAPGSVPDLQGLTLREVFREMQGSDWNFKIYGSGRLVRSIPLAGSPLPKSKPITLIFD